MSSGKAKKKQFFCRNGIQENRQTAKKPDGRKNCIFRSGMRSFSGAGTEKHSLRKDAGMKFSKKGQALRPPRSPVRMPRFVDLMKSRNSITSGSGGTSASAFAIALLMLKP